MSTFLQDVRYGLRILGKSPGVTLVAVLALALGIGANTSIFTVVNALLLHPFAFEHLERLVAVWETAPKQNENRIPAAPANFRDFEEQSRSFEQLAATHGWEVNVTGRGPAERVDGTQVTAGFFPLLGMSAQRGRILSTLDYQPERLSVVVVSYGFWQQQLGLNPEVIGSHIRLNGEQFTVVGVMPRDFGYPMGVEIWAPLDLSAAAAADRTDHYLQVIGRLRPGVSIAQAQADLGAIAGRLGHQFPMTNAGHSIRVASLVNEMQEGTRQFTLVLMGAAGFVLLLACANVANLQLARASARQKEIAVRIAVGASHCRIVRQLLIESLLISLLGAAAGVALANADLEWRRGSIPAFIIKYVPGASHIRIDGWVLAFTIAVAVGAGILAGSGFAWHASRTDLNETLKESSRGAGSGSSSHRLRGLLVVTEVALAVVLLVGAGVMVEGFRNLAKRDLGFDRRNVLTFQVALPESKYREPSQVRAFYDQLVERLAGLPGVEAAAAASTVPGQFGWNNAFYEAEGQLPAAAGELRTTVEELVTPSLFRVLRIPLLQGRTLTSQDGPDSSRVVLVNATLAKRLWPGASPLGKRIRFGPAGSVGPWCTVVGVMGDIATLPVANWTTPMAYFPLSQLTRNSLTLALRTAANPSQLVQAARAQVRALDADQPVYDVRTLEQIIGDDLSGVKASANMMIAYGLIALILSTSGIFAVTAYSVAQRTHEIGVRVALGAQRGDVLRLVTTQGAVLAGAGLAIGVAAALGLVHALSAVLSGVVQPDPLVFVGFTLLLVLVAALAAYIPARQAARVDPMVALRYE